MKKIAYMAPEMEAVELELQGMLCVSSEDEAPQYGGELPGEGPEE